MKRGLEKSVIEIRAMIELLTNDFKKAPNLMFFPSKAFLNHFPFSWDKKFSRARFKIVPTVLAGDQDISLKSLPKHHFGGTWEAIAISTRNISQWTISSETQITINYEIALR